MKIEKSAKKVGRRWSVLYEPNSTNWSQKTLCRSDFSLRYSKDRDLPVRWVKETEKMTFNNFENNFDLKYLVVKSSYVKIRQEHKQVAGDDDKMYS